jgi:uncharacterized protein with PIN domain
MLGTLATWLRIFGEDTAYAKVESDKEIIVQAQRDNRVLLTRDKDLASSVKPSMIINSTDLFEQIKEVIHEFDFNLDDMAVLNRCTVCNTPVEPVERQAVKARVPPHAYTTHRHFWHCPSCNRIYWKGSHWKSIQEFIKSLR